MSVEHRIYIVKRGEFRSPKNPELLTVLPEIIAEYNCSRMPDSFYDLFRNGTEIDFDFYGDNDAEMTVDSYGEHCRMVRPDVVIEYLENLINGADGSWSNYRRIKPLLGLLKSFDLNQWESPRESLWVVHYGY